MKYWQLLLMFFKGIIKAYQQGFTLETLISPFMMHSTLNCFYLVFSPLLVCTTGICLPCMATLYN